MTTNQRDAVQANSYEQAAWTRQRDAYLATLAAAHALAPTLMIPDGTDELSDDQLQAISADLPRTRPAHELISEDREERF